jgi:uncharacterized circularly permuted ATP-grasp superfamily protein
VVRAVQRDDDTQGADDGAESGTALFDGYLEPDRPHADAFDEMFHRDGRVRSAYRALHDAIAPTAATDLAVRSEALDRAYLDQGITFSLSGQERPFPLDIVPRVISAADWAKLQRGIVQRVRALEAFLADIYGDAEIVRDGVLPRRLITSCEHFHRAAAQLTPPNGVRIHVAGIDVVRDEEGTFRVLEDNLRNPSGVSYVMENRRTMARVFPDLFNKQRVRAVADYSVHLLRALRAAAAPNVADPTVVVLTPGVYNSAYFEHSLLARQMGVELVEGRDLFCRDNAVYMRTTVGEQQVDVIYRRIDDEFLDPLQFNPSSVLGIAGVLNAARAGHVVIANAVGNGVGDDKLVYTYVPDMISTRNRCCPTSPRTAAGWTTRRRTCSRTWTSWCSSRSRARAATESCSAPTRAPASSPRPASRSGTTRAAGSPSRWCSSRRCPPRSTTASCRATSTCAPSR